MSLPQPKSHRRPTSSFINDANEGNLIQLSPHNASGNFDQRSPYTMTNNQESRTNFIGDSLPATERPRAVAVSTTGEKYLLDLDVNAPISKSSSNPFTVPSPRYSTPFMERISEQNTSQLSQESVKLHKSSCKLNKVQKSTKRYVSQKPRLNFTPRNMNASSSTQLVARDPAMSKETFENVTTETQTECFLPFSTNLLNQRQCKTVATSATMQYVPMEGSNRYFSEPLNRQQKFLATNSPQLLKPLKIYTKNNPNLKKYSEFRSFASALTLITVLSWLFSTFFDVECLWGFLDSLWQYFQNWFLTKEKPKTKMEILVTFLQDLWS